MTLLWVGLIIIGVVIVLSFAWRGAPPSAEPDTLGEESPRREEQVNAAILVLGVGALAAYAAALYSVFAYDCEGAMVGLGCLSEEDDFVFKLSFYGMLGFAVLGGVAGAIASFWGSTARLICLRLGIAGQAAAFLGSLAIGNIG